MVGLKHWHADSGFVDVLQGIFEPEPLLTLKMGMKYLYVAKQASNGNTSTKCMWPRKCLQDIPSGKKSSNRRRRAVWMSKELLSKPRYKQDMMWKQGPPT